MKAFSFCSVITAFLLSSCGYYLERYPQDGVNSNFEKASLDFAAVKAAVFDSHCVRCHAQYGNYRGVKNEIASIGPAVNSGRMPKGLGPLPGAEKKILNSWIEAGAPETAGKPGGDEHLPLKPEWNSISENIFVPRCVVCHNPLGQARFLNLSAREAVLAEKARVFDSRLILEVVQDDKEPMPPVSSNIRRLTAEEIQTIADWITLGLP